LATTLHPVDVSSKRQRFDAGFAWIAGEQWSTQLTFRRDVRDGLQRISGSFFSSASQMVAPLDQTTDQLALSATYATRRLQASVAYQLSVFRNDESSAAQIVVRGGIPPEFGGGADAEANRKLSRVVVDVLAQFHAVEPAKAELGDLGHPDGFLERQVQGWTGRFERAKTDPFPLADPIAPHPRFGPWTFRQWVVFAGGHDARHADQIREMRPAFRSPAVSSSVLRAIGRTPVLRLRRVVPPGAADVLVKLELANPTGSYKDRMALAMIEGAERRGAPAYCQEPMSAFVPSPPGWPSAPRLKTSISPLTPGLRYWYGRPHGSLGSFSR